MRKLFGKSAFRLFGIGIFMSGQNRSDIQPGLVVDIVLKQDQPIGSLTRGVVQEILTNSEFHPHGIKVRLESGQVGRVQNILESNIP